METINLETPFQPDPRTATSLEVKRLVLDWEGAGIVATLGAADVRKEVVWNGAEATTLMISLNKANLTTKSLHKRVIEQAQIKDPTLAGTIVGVPE